MSGKGNLNGVEPLAVNVIHQQALIEHIATGVGQRILILTPSFPFFFIGVILEVIDDFVRVAVETTPLQELENKQWYIHIDEIELFYIEFPNGPQIPELDDDVC
ncbi:hypothetical protein ACLIBH_07875 [Virgibacillus sp. W0430]|uniref:hypothetical protein n=1 Tax=Virgibacillus sp. W0430 TaxID=3391580 RepID=UPI003F46C8C1